MAPNGLRYYGNEIKKNTRFHENPFILGFDFPADRGFLMGREGNISHRLDGT